MPIKEEVPTVLEGLEDQGRGPEDRCHQKPQASEELLCRKECHHQILQLHSSLPTSGEEEAARTCHARLP